MAKNERTSSAVATSAGQVPNGSPLHECESWLQAMADDPATVEEHRNNAIVLLGILRQLRRVAASALTQRG